MVAHRRQHRHRRVSTPVSVLEARCQNASLRP
jgi:hypothetical protein